MTIGQIMTNEQVATNSLTALDTPHSRFGYDRRLREVERILQMTRIRSISFPEPKGASEAEIASYHQQMVNTIAQRTLSTMIGLAMFDFASKSTTVTDVWPIPIIELSVKLVPGNTTLRAQVSVDHVDWPCFHKGVSAAFSISPNSTGIDSAWIVSNKPIGQLNAEHGGFLLGLGLTGHLKDLLTYHAFSYLDQRNDYTTIGILLGLAGSFVGTEDVLVTKALSLHTHALLPIGSMELNASPLVQSTSLVGLGLVYAGCKNLRMAEVTLNEIGRKDLPGNDGFADYQECYSFSAAISFGLILLGRGGQASSEVDRRLLEKLRKCINGD